jgi:rhodanese-related sulfurtransferase
VRSAEGWNAATKKIKGAIHVSLEEVEKKMKGWKKTQEIVAYCACPDDTTSLSVARTLKNAGFPKVKALWGGWQAWEQASYPTEPK